MLAEATAASLTGPASEIGGLFGNYAGLSKRGWELIDAAIAQVDAARRAVARARLAAGTADAARAAQAANTALARARFARQNVDLYIESVYDGHYDLAHVGKTLTDGYAKLGGAAAFGSSLTPAQVSALAGFYSDQNAELQPHVGVKLGS